MAWSDKIVLVNDSMELTEMMRARRIGWIVDSIVIDIGILKLWKYERREERMGGKKEGSRKESGEDES